ncbi:MAG: hypothetical protein GX285_07215, partial [Clostridiales bacterium]|nr:hypothetical protein [Clostridiales bacterium]
ANCVGIEYSGFETDEHGNVHPSGIKGYFALVRDDTFRKPEFRDYMLERNLCVDETVSRICTVDAVLQGILFSKGALYIDGDIYAPNLMIRTYKVPILCKKALECDPIEQLESNYADEVQKSLQFIGKTLKGYDVTVVYDYILKYFNPSECRRLLKQSYVLDDGTACILTEEECKKTVVAMHLFYQDLFILDRQYIERIPTNVKLLISVSSEENRRLLRQVLGERENTEIIVSCNVGRDWGAFLLDLCPMLKSYEYVFYLHDKKTTGGVGNPLIGQSFMEMMWENLLAGPNYFAHIIKLLESNPRIGLLSPIVPYHGYYVKLLGNSWTVCKEVTKELGEKIGVKIDTSDDNQPFTMSSMFCFRREALAPLLQYPFREEEFPTEPMALDGTLNHALERIIGYVAYSQGYFTGTLQETGSAVTNMINYETMLGKVVADAERSFGNSLLSDIFSGRAYGERIALLRYGLTHEHIRIYGTGNNGRNLASFLDMQNLKYDGFVVTDGYEKAESCCNHDVKYLSELGAASIIVAVDVKYINDVKEQLAKYNRADYFILQIGEKHE